MSMKHLLTGQTIAFRDDPFLCSPEEATLHEGNGSVLVADGTIVDIGPADDLMKRHCGAIIHDYGDSIIMAGLIDAHVHYPQSRIISSWGARLIDWLENYTFPEETRFGDDRYCRLVANRFLDTLVKYGTTSFCTFCTSHAGSVDAIMAAASSVGMRAVAGRTCMDRNVPPALQDTAQTSYDESRELIGKWHGKERLSYAITPRFAPTSSPDQLEVLGALWKEYPDCLMQTHISEQPEEIAWARSLYPDCRDYLDIYERFGLLGQGGLYGHAIHLVEREITAIRDAGASIIHCPTSNMFIGSGMLRVMERKRDGLNVGLASDVGGGSSFSMLRTMAAAYEIAQLQRNPLHPSQLVWLATVGNARAMRMGDRIGNLVSGMEADLVVIDQLSRPEISDACRMTETVWDQLFPTIMMGDDRAIQDVWIGGKRLHRDRERDSGPDFASLD